MNLRPDGVTRAVKLWEESKGGKPEIDALKKLGFTHFIKIPPSSHDVYVLGRKPQKIYCRGMLVTAIHGITADTSALHWRDRVAPDGVDVLQALGAPHVFQIHQPGSENIGVFFNMGHPDALMMPVLGTYLMEGNSMRPGFVLLGSGSDLSLSRGRINLLRVPRGQRESLRVAINFAQVKINDYKEDEALGRGGEEEWKGIRSNFENLVTGGAILRNQVQNLLEALKRNLNDKTKYLELSIKILADLLGESSVG